MNPKTQKLSVYEDISIILFILQFSQLVSKNAATQSNAHKINNDYFL